jgi:hypothetical protein
LRTIITQIIAPESRSQVNNGQLSSHFSAGAAPLPANTVIIRSLILNAMRQPPGKRSLVGVDLVIYHAKRAIGKKKEAHVATIGLAQSAVFKAASCRSAAGRQRARPAKLAGCSLREAPTAWQNLNNLAFNRVGIWCAVP